MTTVLTGKALTLKVGTVVFTEQTTSAKLTSEEQSDTIELTTGSTVEIPKGTKQTLTLSALQDWTDPDGLAAVMATAHSTRASLTFTLELEDLDGAKSTVTGTVAPRLLDFGGDAGALQGDVDLPVLDSPVYPVHTVAGP